MDTQPGGGFAGGQNYPTHSQVLTPKSYPSQGLTLPEPAGEVLHNDCDPADAVELSRGIVPHAYATFEAKSTARAWANEGFDGRRAYICTPDDACNPSVCPGFVAREDGSPLVCG